MTTTEVYEKPKLSCKSRGPGPAYNLPTLVGYNDHDPSRHRYPAYSLRKRLDSKGETVGPGPDYNVDHLTEKGLDKPPEFTIAGRAPFKVIGFGPGPGAYNPEKCPPMNHSKRPPAYSLKSRLTNKYDNSGPGPNAYTVPTCLGPSIPDKRAFGAFTITGLRSQQKKYVGPSPAQYTKLNYDVIKKKTPAYSMKYRHNTRSQSSGPGPQYYPLYNTKKNSPQFSFGVRHSDCASPARVELDDLED